MRKDKEMWIIQDSSHMGSGIWVSQELDSGLQLQHSGCLLTGACCNTFHNRRGRLHSLWWCIQLPSTYQTAQCILPAAYGHCRTDSAHDEFYWRSKSYRSLQCSFSQYRTLRKKENYHRLPLTYTAFCNATTTCGTGEWGISILGSFQDLAWQNHSCPAQLLVRSLLWVGGRSEEIPAEVPSTSTAGIIWLQRAE